jgi:hypothetical protein
MIRLLDSPSPSHPSPSPSHPHSQPHPNILFEDIGQFSNIQVFNRVLFLLKIFVLCKYFLVRYVG